MKRLYISALLGGAMLVGCDDKKDTVTPKVEEKVNKATDSIKDATKTGVDAVKDATKTGVDTVKDATKTTTDAGKTAMDAAKEQGSKLIEQFQAAITGNKMTEADGIMKQIEAIKDKLPEDLKAKYESAKKMFDVAKAKLGGAVPAIPK